MMLHLQAGFQRLLAFREEEVEEAVTWGVGNSVDGGRLMNGIWGLD